MRYGRRHKPSNGHLMARRKGPKLADLFMANRGGYPCSFQIYEDFAEEIQWAVALTERRCLRSSGNCESP